MAELTTLGGDGKLFVGEDKTIELPVNDKLTGLPIDITGWSILFDLRKSVTAADPALLSQTAAIVGIYNVDPLVNTQRARVTFTDTELNTLKAGTYQRSWKRMDDSSETVLCYGPAIFEKATAP